MTATIDDEAALRAVYDHPKKLVADAHAGRLDDLCCRFIALSPMVIVASHKAHGEIDISPRGGPPGFVLAVDDTTLAIPDRAGNNKVETLTNLTHDPSVGLMFVIPGIDEMLRLRGRAAISTDPQLLSRLAEDGAPPKTAIVVTVDRVYPHCGKAFKRARLWDPESRRERKRDRVPSLGEIAIAMARPEGVDAAKLDGAVSAEYAAIDAAAQKDRP